MTRFVQAAAVLAACCFGVPVQGDGSSLPQDLVVMKQWFTGEFDNYWQARKDEAEEVEHPHERIHSIFTPVDLPAFGEHVFYVQQYLDGDPQKVYRQRIYTFGIDEAEDAIELVIYVPPDPKAVLDAHLDPAKLDGLTPEATTRYPGCEVYWKRDGDAFIGYTKESACRVESRRSGRTLIISDDLKLTESEIWIQDRAEDTEGNYIYGNKAGIAHKLQRTRDFDCWVALRKVTEAEGWHSWRGLRLHDQGGMAQLEPEGGGEGRYSIELFQAVYEGGSQVPILELALREKDKDKSLAYAWASPDSRRIGINLRWIQTGCTAVQSP